MHSDHLGSQGRGTRALLITYRSLRWFTQRFRVKLANPRMRILSAPHGVLEISLRFDSYLNNIVRADGLSLSSWRKLNDLNSRLKRSDARPATTEPEEASLLRPSVTGCMTIRSVKDQRRPPILQILLM